MKISNRVNLFFKIFCVLAVLFLIFINLPQMAHTAPAEGTKTEETKTTDGYGLKEAAEKAELKMGGDISTRIGKIITAVISFVGVIFLILIVAGGLMWMTAGGSEEKIGKAKKLIVNATVGVIIIFLSYAIVYFVMEKIAG